MDRDEIVKVLEHELRKFSQIAFAFLFGSAVSDRLRTDSDLDVAVYIADHRELQIEEFSATDHETEIQIACERVTSRNVDLLLLNRAPATVCASALLTGEPILVRDRALYTRYFLAVTDVAIQFLRTEQEFNEIRDRSHSLSPIDVARINRIIRFVNDELEDRESFASVTLERYSSERDLRRNLDRWVETLINSAIDIGKIVLSSEGRSAPQTYGQILLELESIPAFAPTQYRLAPFASLRNILAHEYLDLRFGRVIEFVENGAAAVGELAGLVNNWLDANRLDR